MDSFTGRLLAAALEARAAQPAAPRRCDGLLAESLTAAELRVLKLLPASSYSQIAATLYVSRNTAKTRLRSIYQKLGVASRSQALERAADLRLLCAAVVAVTEASGSQRARDRTGPAIPAPWSSW